MTFEGPPHQNAWAHAPAPSSFTSACPSARRTASGSGRRTPGGNPKARQAPEGPLPRGLAPPSLGLGPQAPSPDSPCLPAATRATRGAAGHSGRKNGQGPLSHWRLSKALRAKTLVPTLPLPSALTSARPSAPCTEGGSGLPVLCGLTLTLGWPSRVPPKDSGAYMPGIWDPKPQNHTHAAATPPPGPLGAPPLIQGGRTDRALEKPATFEASRAKMQGPTLPLTSAFTSARPPLAAQPEVWACRPPGC